MDINLRITIPEEVNPSAEPARYGEIEAKVLDWIQDGLFPEETVVALENDGVGHLVPPHDSQPRHGHFNPSTNRPRPTVRKSTFQ